MVVATAISPVILDHEKVSMKGDNESVHDEMLALCRKALPGWDRLAFDDVEFSTVSGGISNINAKLAPRPDLGLAPVMFKVFGDNTDQIVDRAAERITVTALGKQGCGPKVFVLFGNGRIEEWLNCSGVTPQDMCSENFIPRIAQQLRRFHATDIELDKAPNTPWGVISDYLAQAKQLEFTDPMKKEGFQQIDLDALEKDIEETRSVCELTNSPLVFGHNDLLSGNIVILQQPGFNPEAPDREGPLCFIDYEYGAYTFRGYDIGNHFTEYAGFEGDYTRYPTRQQQELFFTHYLAEHESAAAGPLDPAVLDRLSAEANAFALASHLYWGVWAIIQARYSPIDFDYMKFAHTRLGEFKRRKDEWLNEARRVFGPGEALLN